MWGQITTGVLAVSKEQKEVGCSLDQRLFSWYTNVLDENKRRLQRHCPSLTILVSQTLLLGD